MGVRLPELGLRAAGARAMRSRPTFTLLAFVAVLTLASCSGTGDTTETTDPAPPSSVTTSLEAAASVAYVEEALAFMEAAFYRSDDTDWVALREEALAIVEDDPSLDGAHQAVQHATESLDTLHTWFVHPGEEEGADDREPPSGERLGDVGYLHLPGNAGGSVLTVEYATQVREIIEEIDDGDAVCGWILDLRDSLGGNSVGDWLALGPLVGDPLLMKAQRIVGGPTSVFYEDGQIRYEGDTIPGGELTLTERMPPDAYVPERLDVPVALLISSRTISAGEAVAVTFANRPHTRSFGEQTAGATTTFEAHAMPDGGILRVASGLYQDHTGRDYEGGVPPDEPVPTDSDGDDAAIESALSWVTTQASCT